MYPEEYPQIFVSREIIHSMAYPSPPKEPKEPKKLDTSRPNKYDDVYINLFNMGLFVILFFIAFFWCKWSYNGYSFTLLLGSIIGFLVFLFKLFNSFDEIKNFPKKLADYEKLVQDYETESASYEERKARFIKEKKEYDDLIKTIKNNDDLFDYRMKNRKAYLQKIKSKDRHKWFFDTKRYNDVRLGRAELFFRDYLLNAKKNNQIPQDLDLYFTAQIELLSLYSNKASFFYPDILVHTPRGLLIDVEIDEPYTSDTKKPIHCIHSLENNDFSRNEHFVNNDCNVIRFSERQIIKYPDICLQIICSFDDYANIPKNLILPPDFIEKAWYEEDAKKMALENYRNSY